MDEKIEKYSTKNFFTKPIEVETNSPFPLPVEYSYYYSDLLGAVTEVDCQLTNLVL
ncbi:hypothetical protein HK096_009553, partial [Nowakowskiella sp. JEL0078]